MLALKAEGTRADKLKTLGRRQQCLAHPWAATKHALILIRRSIALSSSLVLALVTGATGFI
ncbi:MAG: hypothetical protein J7601_03650, partial [Chloroflexi bacterium]|nr:hypothetical protein [Chloroflexota bacterium]